MILVFQTCSSLKKFDLKMHTVYLFGSSKKELVDENKQLK